MGERREVTGLVIELSRDDRRRRRRQGREPHRPLGRARPAPRGRRTSPRSSASATPTGATPRWRRAAPSSPCAASTREPCRGRPAHRPHPRRAVGRPDHRRAARLAARHGARRSRACATATPPSRRRRCGRSRRSSISSRSRTRTAGADVPGGPRLAVRGPREAFGRFVGRKDELRKIGEVLAAATRRSRAGHHHPRRSRRRQDPPAPRGRAAPAQGRLQRGLPHGHVPAARQRVLALRDREHAPGALRHERGRLATRACTPCSRVFARSASRPKRSTRC